MSRWFRWYDGTTEDGKFRVVARLSRVTVRDVIALWAFILEDAAHLEHRGVCKRNEDFMAGVLDFDEGTVELILEAMESANMISVGYGAITVCNWGKRQFEGDVDPTAADRQRRKRERDKPPSNEPVTRDSRPPDTETDTQTEKKEDSEDKSSATTSEETELFRRGKEILGPKAGGMVANLLKARGGSVPLARAALETAATKNNPREWIGAHLSNSDDKRPWPRGFKPKSSDKKDWPEDFHPPPGAKIRRLQFDDGTVIWDFEQHAM